MPRTRPQKHDLRVQGDFSSDLPPGVKLFRTFEGHEAIVFSVAFDPRGERLASASKDKTIKLWDLHTGNLLYTLEGHQRGIWSVAFDPRGEILASGSEDYTVRLWEARSGKPLRTLEGHQGFVFCTAFDPQSGTLASGAHDHTVKLWAPRSGVLLGTLDHKGNVSSVAFEPKGRMMASGGSNEIRLWDVQTRQLLHTITIKGTESVVESVTFSPQTDILVSGGMDSTIKIWDTRTGKLLRTLEGHTDIVDVVTFSPDGRLLASKSNDETIRLWNCATWEAVAIIPEVKQAGWLPTLAFHPTLPLLASAGRARDGSDIKEDWLIHVWELDYDVVMSQRALGPTGRAIHHTTAKIVLVGDHSVGKSALGHRLIHGIFKEQASTHGQQFWVFPALGKRRADETECEAILWDFAGQPDYRLVHALFLDNADLALVLFDASEIRDPLRGVGFWLKQLKTGQSSCPIILVAAQSDRGSSSLTSEELKTFCQKNGIVDSITTSSATGAGIDELVERMKSLIPWEEKPSTVTTVAFKRIKDYVLGLKESESQRQTIVTPEELRGLLKVAFAQWHFTDAEMMTAVGHLENYGYVKRLRTSKGELRILLRPETLNNLASSFVLEARRNPRGLGALEEKQLLVGGYAFPELKDLAQAERDVLIDSAALLFLEHNVCFRETDPLRMEPYLVFPELINLKKPPEEDAATDDGVAYTVIGPTENVFASLVVLLGYTHAFTRTSQWQNNARYEVGDGLVCGFRQEAERDGELDFVLCFAPTVGTPLRTLFQGLFESFLARRNLTVMRYEPVRCTNLECSCLLERSVVRQRMNEGKTFVFCNACGEKLILPAMTEPIQLTQEVQVKVESQRRAAEQRTRFEQAVFRLRTYIAEQDMKPPDCFISYAWGGEPNYERWVERLATDLQKAGIEVLLDRWHNAQIGASVARFIERIDECDRVVVIGTPLYREKAKNLEDTKGSVVAAEYDLAVIRLLATEAQKRTVLPVLLAGNGSESFPPLLRGKVYADFRKEEAYFSTAFDLILSIYQLLPNEPAVANLRESLRAPDMVSGSKLAAVYIKNEFN